MNLHESKELLPLIQNSIKGKRRAHNALYKAAYPYAMSIALRYAANNEDSAEIVNEAFYKVFTYLKNYDPTQSFAAWLRKIVVNTAIDHYNSRSKRQEVLGGFDDDRYLEPEVDDLIEKIDAQELLFHIQNLPPTYRMVFSLFAVEGYSHKDIASQLGISEGTSKSNYHKAKTKLKLQLFKEGLAPKKQAQ